MIAFFQLSPIHMLILLVVGIAVISVPVLVVLMFLRQTQNSDRSANDSATTELRSELEHLRAEVERLKKKAGE
jgi:hypothetical protein